MENCQNNEDYDKKFAVLNPSRMCMPMGAVQAMMGVKNAMPLIHGSQGCATYMRFQLIRHFREPIEVASTSLSEKTVIYGGEVNLLKGLKNISEKQNPEIIGVMSTCLTETIGDDVYGAISKFEDANVGLKLPEMFSIETPSYAGSHIEGYDKAILSMLRHFARKTIENDKVNIVMGFQSPGNTKEIKEILKDLNIDAIILTDNSENLDGPLDESTLELHQYGTTKEELEDSANSIATIAISKHCYSGAKFLEETFNVRAISPHSPIGIKYTDEFINNLITLTNTKVSEKVLRDRGRLQDALVDAHSYNYRKKVAIFGDPDMVIGLASLTSEMGMIPEVLAIGIESEIFRKDMEELIKDIKEAYQDYNPIVLENKDLYDLEQVLNNHKVDVLIGNAYGSSIAKKENIP
ncbi:MAG: nitrogenase, partial [Methanobrevibacter sp.]|nr:nitrogenase [Methanobrevibacter sp.]